MFENWPQGGFQDKTPTSSTERRISRLTLPSELASDGVVCCSSAPVDLWGRILPELFSAARTKSDVVAHEDSYAFAQSLI